MISSLTTAIAPLPTNALDIFSINPRPVLADEAGAFGNPTSDSLRTAVTPGTRALLMVVFAPADLPRATLAEHGEEAAALIRAHLQPPGTMSPIPAAVFAAQG